MYIYIIYIYILSRFSRINLIYVLIPLIWRFPEMTMVRG